MGKYLLIILLGLCSTFCITAFAGLINPPYIFSNVSPKEGSLYITDQFVRDHNYYNYIYAFDLSNADNSTIQGSKDLVLTIFNTSSPLNQKNWLYSEKNGTLNESTSTLIFNLNSTKIFGENEFLGELRYQLSKGNSIIAEGRGPNIIFNFRNEISKKQNSGLYTYSVEVRSLRKEAWISITYKNESDVWEPYIYESQFYKSNDMEWKLLEWKDMPYYRELEFGEYSNQSSYQIKNPQDFRIEQTFRTNLTNNSEISYKISLNNPTDCIIRQIKVIDTIPRKMRYVNSTPRLKENNLDYNRTLVFNIDDLGPNNTSNIDLILEIDPEVIESDKEKAGELASENKIIVEGKKIGASVSSQSDRAENDIGPLG